jgi:hypothetical protein
MDKMAMAAIALYPTGNMSGAWVFLHFKTLTLKPTVRSRWVPKSMSDIALKFLNELADAEHALAVLVEEVAGDNNHVVDDMDDIIMLNQKW